MNKSFTYISLFSSAGVGCYGFKKEGFECVATSEIIERRIEVQRCNKVCKYDAGYISGDIKSDETKHKIFKEIERWKNKDSIKDIDVLIATPPCQGMSVANLKKKNEMGRNSLVVESIKLTKEIKPKFFVFENVRAFLNTVCTDIDGENRKIKDSINQNLGGLYNILFKVVNFKDYGNPSSRTRTLVIGVRKDLWDVSPYFLFPKKQSEKKLRDVIGDLPSLKMMGEISKNDIYHNFRKYPEYMVDWIKNLKEGESAFDDVNGDNLPYKMVDGKKVINQNKNGDKYRRWYMDRCAPCIHTRNDQLASQCTIHPFDNRVYSVRELMRIMSIPEEFSWVNKSLKELNKLSFEEKVSFLKKNEMNIRQCIGEAVPTTIFNQIAKNIKEFLINGKLNENEIKLIIKRENLVENCHTNKFIERNLDKYTYWELSKVAELSNAEKFNTAAFYTRQDVIFSIIKDLPDFNDLEEINILEPSVGAGNFLPLLFEKYCDVKKVNISVVDIDSNTLEVLKILLKKINIPKNIHIDYINDDFLLHKFNKKFDLVIGNPPFKKLTKNKDLLEVYRKDKFNKETNNLFSFFIEKSIGISKYVSLIVPKSLISAPEFNKTRELMNNYSIEKITDYGERGFKGVKIETISFILKTSDFKKDSKTLIESYILMERFIRNQDYVTDKKFPVWLLYRDSFFDGVVDKLHLGLFTSYRDRQITKKYTRTSGKIRVLKSRNISSNEIKNIDGYDCYLDEYSDFAISKFLNQKNIVLVPNLTYKPRACFLPKNSIADGSVALLQLKINDLEVSKNDLKYFNTEEFRKFYMISRNLGTRSLNIDNNAVYFFGVEKKKDISYNRAK